MARQQRWAALAAASGALAVGAQGTAQAAVVGGTGSSSGSSPIMMCGIPTTGATPGTAVSPSVAPGAAGSTSARPPTVTPAASPPAGASTPSPPTGTSTPTSPTVSPTATPPVSTSPTVPCIGASGNVYIFYVFAVTTTTTTTNVTAPVLAANGAITWIPTAPTAAPAAPAAAPAAPTSVPAGGVPAAQGSAPQTGPALEMIADTRLRATRGGGRKVSNRRVKLICEPASAVKANRRYGSVRGSTLQRKLASFRKRHPARVVLYCWSA
jgi:hypothetical protein